METEKKECKKCNSGLSMNHKTILVISFYILFAAIYGTIKIIQDLSSNL